MEGTPPNSPWKLGLRQRTVVLVLLIPASVLVVGLPLLFVSQHRRAEREFIDKLRSEARVLALALADPCQRDCLHEVEPPVRELLAADASLVSVEILEQGTGEVLAVWGDAPAVTGAELVRYALGSEEQVLVSEEGHPGSVLHGEGHLFQAVTPLQTQRWGDRGLPLLRLRGSSQAHNERVVNLLLLALVPGGAAGLGGVLLALWLNRRLRTAVRSIHEATLEIAQGNLERRLELRTGDELEALGESVNVMAGALAAQRRQLDAHASELQQALAERTLELQKARAVAVNQERIAAMGVLAAGVAHEIGNPLTAISAIVQGMRRRPDGEASEKVDVLAENLARIQQIVRSLVDYARAPGDDWSSVSLNALLQRTLALVRLDPRAKDVTLRERLDPELPRIESVESKLQQVFLNLVLNALDAVGGRGEVAIGSADRGHEVCVTVDDTGPGVPAELRETIFDAFFTTKAAQGGSGLGLAVSAQLIEELGGRLTVADAPLGGARFEVRIPVRREVST